MVDYISKIVFQIIVNTIYCFNMVTDDVFFRGSAYIANKTRLVKLLLSVSAYIANKTRLVKFLVKSYFIIE